MNFCKCGCGEIVSRNYKKGHNRKGLKSDYDHVCKRIFSRKGYWPMSEVRKECGCGCGELAKPGSSFILGHAARVMSDEQKKKISKTLTGKPHPHSKETRKKLSEAHKGKVVSEEAKENMSKGQKRRWKDPEQYKKLCAINKGRCGPDAPAWRGGIQADPYCDAWLDKEFKESIRERDNHECQNPDCWGNCNNSILNIHHINYNKKDCRPINLISICPSCNSRANFKRKNWEKLYTKLNSSRLN